MRRRILPITLLCIGLFVVAALFIRSRLPWVSLEFWRTYENRELGFRVKYPPNYSYRFGQGFPSGIWLFDLGFNDADFLQAVDLLQEMNKLIPGMAFLAQQGAPGIGISVIDNPRGLPLDQYIQAHFDPTQYVPPPHSDEQILFRSLEDLRELQVNGVRAVEFVDQPMGIRSRTVLVPHGAKLIMFNLAFEDRFPDRNQILERMVSTLELLR